jgi:hydrogenase large subunit
MGKRITVDPVTRIEGHLRIDVEVDGGTVKNAWSSGQMFRGIETILLGRDPRDAWLFTQRFCGVCTTVHAITSVRAVENALGLEVPLNAQYIRNLIITAHALHDHVVHFYHLSALDWVDVVAALSADPAKAAALAESLSDWPGNGRLQLQGVKDRLKGFVDGGQLGVFQNGYWGHPAMKLSPEVNLLAVSHYLQALEIQRKANQVVAILGGKTPNIQNLAVGGVANAINLDNQATINMDKLYAVKDLLQSVQDFITKVYFVDVCAVAAMYPSWLGIGKGARTTFPYPTSRSTRRGRGSRCPAGRSSTATSPPSRRSPRSRTRTSSRTSPSRSRTPGTTATGRSTPSTRRRCRSTAPTTRTGSTRGSSRRASPASRCRSGRWRRSSPASR